MALDIVRADLFGVRTLRLIEELEFLEQLEKETEPLYKYNKTPSASGLKSEGKVEA
jgi:hypothetical protein